tara:strand:- start:39 stop:731 length:693 start_codon:yes stop_codon:yes gene_type:complete
MKLFFVGDSWTWGDGLRKPHEKKDKIYEKRFSTIIGKKLGAEVVNEAICGLSNHAITRILLEQDLDQYDCIFVQFTYPARTEFFDVTGIPHNARKITTLKHMKKHIPSKYENCKRKLDSEVFTSRWQNILPHFFRWMESGFLLDGREFYEQWYEEIYHDEMGRVDEMLLYNLIKTKLTLLNKKHVITTIFPRSSLPVDLNLNKGKYQLDATNHPTHFGHIMIARDIIDLL